MHRLAQVAMLQLAIMNLRLMLDDEVQARRRQRAKRFWGPAMVISRQTATSCTYDQLIRDPRMVDSSAFFNYMRMKPFMFDVILDRVGLESKRLLPTSGMHLNHA